MVLELMKELRSRMALSYLANADSRIIHNVKEHTISHYLQCIQSKSDTAQK
ncbi:hypothetical protein [Myroides profundi]|uniref:Uncharacterized protein n=1 Tax=Myroides profundi TaxID=480520 RepID=A0AAJ5BC96_MYRPR|nr:hypothetical protein [Myroides profundi]AJH13580.1 hypothetical protein MPR_0368 [Myroides profundi]SEP93111.1 hypothetical protein SAMN04488089_101122 [Myroides profundi]